MSYAQEFIDKPKIHEQIFVGFLWSNPELYNKYRSNNFTRKTFSLNSDIWWFFYSLGKDMFDNGIRNFDDTTVYSFIVSQPQQVGRKKIIDEYNSYGGYDMILELMEECETDKKNDEYHCSEMQKYEMLRYFQDEGLLDVNKVIETKGVRRKLVDILCSMSLVQLKMFFQLKNKTATANINNGEIKIYNFLDNMNDTIEKLNQGESMGLSFKNSPLLNKKIKGWKLGNLMYLVLASGVGKSSISMEKAVLALIENNEKGIIFANEEDVFKWRALLLATVSSAILRNGISRERIMEGNYAEDEFKKINNAKDWLNTHRPDIIKFVEMNKYRIEDVINNIELLRPLGYKHILFDTFKPDSSRGESARWEKFSDHAQDLYDCIKPQSNNCACLATVQLKIGKEYRYLDLDTIGKSLEIVEVAGTVMVGRLMYSDEYSGEKNEIKVYHWKKNEFDGKYYKDYDVHINKDRQYLILFIPKNRNGGTEEQIVFEINYKFNFWKEMGLCQVPRTPRNIN